MSEKVRRVVLSGWIRTFRATLAHSKLARDAWRVFSLQAGVQSINLFTTLYSIRLMGPRELGVAAFALACSNYAVTCSDLGLDIAGIREFARDRDGVFSTVMMLRGIASVCCVLLTVGFFAVFRPQGGALLWVAAALQVPVRSLFPRWTYQALEILPTFNLIAFVQSLAAAGLTIVALPNRPHADCYAVIGLVAQIFATATAIVVLYAGAGIRLVKPPIRQTIAMLRRSGRAFAIIIAVSLYAACEIPIISVLLSAEEAGYYKAAQSTISGLVPILSTVATLVYPRLVAWTRLSGTEFALRLRVLTGTLAVIAVVMATGSWIVLPTLTIAVLGSRFAPAVAPAMLLVAAKGVVMVSTPCAWGIHALDEDRRLLRIVVGVAMVSLSLNLGLTARLGILMPAAVNVVSESLILTCASYVVARVLRERERKGAALVSCESRGAVALDGI
jgi:PST family polysaccharide transporter